MLRILRPLATAAVLALSVAAPAALAQGTPPFSRLIVFGDSLSDTGNVSNITDDKFNVRYPSGETGFNYDDGRFTNGPDTDPNEVAYDGVWHEQLARVFLGLPRAKPSTDDGLDYAYGGATTKDGTKDVTVVSNPIPFGGGRLTITIKNMGRQVDDFLGRNPQPDPAALYIVWGGGNDLFNDPSAENVTDATTRIPALVERLARAGAVNFLVPNVPPLGAVPNYNGDAEASARLNQASSDFRDQLVVKLDALQDRLKVEGIPFKIYRLDVYGLFQQFAVLPAAYNFTNITEPVQGNGDAQAERYLFWDNVHPTTGGHYQLAAEAQTVLGGAPVVQIGPAKTDVSLKTGEVALFYLSRTGADVSQTLTVPYTVGGTAVAGTDYYALKGVKTFAAGKRTTKIKVFTIPAAPGTSKKTLKLTVGTGAGYTLPVVVTAKVNLRTDR